MRLQLTDGYYLHFGIFSAILKYSNENLIKKKISVGELVDLLGHSHMTTMASTKLMIELGLLIPRSLRITEFGAHVAKYDPFFENNATLWICHYIISSNPDNYVWHRFTNEIIPNISDYTTEDFYKYYKDVSENNSGKSANKSMHKEIKSVLNAYTEKQFRALRILYRDYEKKYQQDTPKDINPLVFLYTLFLYIENKGINASALTLEEVIENEDTPSKIFHLDSYQVNDILNRLHSMQLITLENFGDLNQVRFNSRLDKEALLNKIYQVEGTN